MVNILDVAKKAVASATGSTGIWAVIITAATFAVTEIGPDVMNYIIAGDYVTGAAYAVGMVVAVVIMAVIIEMAGEYITKKE